VRIEGIYLATHKLDLPFTRICVASIRFWYPDIPVWLINDYGNGDYSTREFKESWNVQDYQTEKRCFGWGLSKLEPIVQQRRSRMLVLDSDTVFTGRVLDGLQPYDADFVVDWELQPPEGIDAAYFDRQQLHTWDPDFEYPGYTFNTGQFVTTSGILERRDFEGLVNWSTNPPHVRFPHIFKNADQGLLNYLVMKKERAGELTVARAHFMKWGKEEMDEINLAQMARNSPYRSILHWAGLKKARRTDMLRSDILRFFEDLYYSRATARAHRGSWR
jgi:lipopolysaccharide biosynthesis glycosyltransferase